MNEKKIRVLITSNPLNHEGGVVNYYNILLKNNKFSHIKFYHAAIGSPSNLFYFPLLKKILYPFHLFVAWISLFYKIKKLRIDIVQVNPSLIPVPVLRDFITILICKILKRKCIVFFRGWKEPFYHKIVRCKILKRLFVSILKKTDKILVLANSFKNDLVSIGIEENKIIRTTTVIDEQNILVPINRKNKPKIKILYLGRISKLKGMDEFSEAIIKLFKNNNEYISKVEVIIVGHEDRKGYINEVKQKLNEFVNKECVKFLGRIENKEKFEIYADSDFYVFPSWTEGCPNSVLEALASGLFVIGTNVGALNDIIEPPNNGIFVQKQSANDLFQKILFAIQNIDNIRERKEQIHKKYIQEFSSQKILTFLSNLYNQILYDSNS